jgi:aspartate racemase
MKSLAILGGMGPRATMMFYEQILNETKVNKDWEHIPCVINIATDIPSRTLVAQGKEDEKTLIDKSIIHIYEMLWTLGLTGGYIASPCNSFSFFRNKIIKELEKYEEYDGLDINKIWIDIIEITSKEVLSKGYTKPLILGGWIVNNKREDMYEKYFPDAVYLDDNKQTNQFIEDIKTNSANIDNKKSYDNFIDLLNSIEEKELNFDCIILACTELIILKDDMFFNERNYKIFDSSSIYAREIVRICKSE